MNRNQETFKKNIHQRLDELKQRLGLSQDDIDVENRLLLILEEAEADVLDYCRRTDMTGSMYIRARQIAIIRWNRQGTEGEEFRSEGGVSQRFEDIPADILSKLNQFRRGKVRSL